jgi:hypothetical protein
MAILACARRGTRKVSVGMVVVATADVATWPLARLVRTSVLDVQLVVFSFQFYKVEVAVRFDGDALVLESLKMGPPRCKRWLDGDRTRFIHRCLLRVDFAFPDRSANQHADQMQFIRRMRQQIAVDRAIHALRGEGGWPGPVHGSRRQCSLGSAWPLSASRITVRHRGIQSHIS